jgi:hypothetical protein
MRKTIFIFSLSIFLVVKNVFAQEIFSVVFSPFGEASFDLDSLRSLGLADTLKVNNLDTSASGMVVVNCYFINNMDRTDLFGLSINRVIFEDSNKKRDIVNPLDDVLVLSLSEKILKILGEKSKILINNIRTPRDNQVSKVAIVLFFKIED